MSEERDPIYQKAAKENHISQFDGMDSFHIDKEHDVSITIVVTNFYRNFILSTHKSYK